MAKLNKRGRLYSARVRWYEKGKQKEKTIGLITDSERIAMERIREIDKVEKYMKKGLSFTFPWESEKTIQTQLKRFTLMDAAEEWMESRIDSVSKSTFKTNWYGLNYLIDCLGKNKAFMDINNKDILHYSSTLSKNRLSSTSVNIHLKTVRTLFNYFKHIGKIETVPLIQQKPTPKKERSYLTDHEFEGLCGLDALDNFYKRVFLLYRDTGMRLREPFFSKLDGKWIDIPIESKSNRSRSIELTPNLKSIFIELKEWQLEGYGSNLKDPGEHISKRFKKALREIGASEDKRFHSLRHTYAVRNLLQDMSIYDLKLNLGHASVVDTEVYSEMNLKRIAQDFPTLRTQNSLALSSLRGSLTRGNDSKVEDQSHLLHKLTGSD